MISRFLCVAACLIAQSLWSSAVSADSRIKTLRYSEDRVVDLIGVYGYQISIEFPDDEIIENVAVGDSLAWQVTPNKAATTLFVKPVDESEPTNMTVLTTGRRYSFALTAKRQSEIEDGDVVFVMRFEPEERRKQPESTAVQGPAVPKPDFASSDKTNKKYTYTGARSIVPSKVFDDGRVTYFQWPEGVEAPAIFIVGSDKMESTVNFAYAGDFIVVDRVAAEFLLRRGSDVTRLHNDGFVPIDPGPDAPLPRIEHERRSVFSRFRKTDE